MAQKPEIRSVIESEDGVGKAIHLRWEIWNTPKPGRKAPVRVDQSQNSWYPQSIHPQTRVYPPQRISAQAPV
jgi:hypothetical protein